MRGPSVTRSIVVVLAAWALVMILPDLTRPFRPLATVGLTADFGGRIVAVEPGGPAAGAGIRPQTQARRGDRIDFERTPPETLFRLYGGFGGRPFFLSGTHIELDLIGPDGTLRAVELEAAEREPPFGERISLFFAELLGIGFICLGAFLAWHFPERRDVFGFFLYSIWFNPGENYVFYALLPRAAWVPQEMLSALLAALALAGFITFALRFPTDRSEGWRRPVERLLPLLVIVLAGLTIVGSGAEFGRPSRALWLWAFWLEVALYPLVVAAFLTKLRILPPVDRQRLRLVIFGCIPGLFFFLLAESVDAMSLWEPLFDRLAWSPPEILLDCGYLVNALVPISIGYAVLRRHVLPINFIVNRGLTLGIVWVIVAMSVEAIVLTTHSLLEENHVLSTLLLAAALVAVAPLLERLKELVNDYVDRFLFVRLNVAKRELEASAQQLATSATRAQIEAAIIERPCDALGLASAALFALDDDDGAYRIVARRNWPADASDVIGADDPLVRRFRHGGPEATFRGTIHDRVDVPAGAARPDLFLSLTPGPYFEAFAIYSGHTDGSTLTPDEVTVMIRFARECGAVRAHLAALTMRREVARLRRLLDGNDELGRPQAAVSAPARPVEESANPK
jgi:hypothetical protein